MQVVRLDIICILITCIWNEQDAGKIYFKDTW